MTNEEDTTMRSLVFVVLFLFPYLASAQHVADHPDSVVDAVEHFQAALAAGDSTTVAEMLLPDAVILEAGVFETKEEYFDHHFGADVAFLTNMNREIERRQVDIEGEAAWVSTTSRVWGVHRGEDVDISSAELMVLRRTSNGWQVAAIHWSSRPR